MMRLPVTIATPKGLSVEGAGANLLAELLDKLEQELRKQGVPVDEYFCPGAPAAEVRSTFANNGLVAPDEAVVWFGWHDGVDRSRPSDKVLPKFFSWSLSETVTSRLKLDPNFIGFEDWQVDPRWMQILGEQYGITVRCDDVPENPPLVRALTFAEPSYASTYTHQQVVSLCTPVTWWIEALRQGLFTWLPEFDGWDIQDRKLPGDRSRTGIV